MTDTSGAELTLRLGTRASPLALHQARLVRDLIEALDGDESPLATVQGATRIVTFYRKKLLEVGYIKTGV